MVSLACPRTPMRLLLLAAVLLADATITAVSTADGTAAATPAADRAAPTAAAAVPLETLSQRDVQALLAAWGLAALRPAFGTADGRFLAVLGEDDLAVALEDARGLEERLALKVLFSRLDEVRAKGGVVVAPDHGSGADEASSSAGRGGANSGADRRLLGGSAAAVDIGAGGTVAWDKLSLDGFSGVSMKRNASALLFGAGATPPAVFRAGAEWLGVRGGLSVQGDIIAPNLAALVADVSTLLEWKANVTAAGGLGGSGGDAAFDTLTVANNVTVGEHLNWDYKSTHLHAYLDKIDELGDAVLQLEGLVTNSKANPAASCQAALTNSTDSGVFWIQTYSMSSPAQMYCDQDTDDGGWTLVGVALVDYAGESGWNEDDGLNLALSYSLDDHWHQSATVINDLLSAGDALTRAVCFDSSNDYTRYWYGTGSYSWEAVSGADSTTDGYYSGTSYSTVWASHHYGLVSGNSETTTLITAHSGNHWACGGNTAPGGEGYTGRSGVSNFRMWVR